MKKIFPFLLVMSLVSCSSLGGGKGVPFNGLNEINPSFAHVYIYRTSGFTMGLAIPTTRIGDEEVEGVRDGSYVLFELPTGVHKISFSNNANWAAGSSEIDMKFEAGKRYFFRLAPYTSGTELSGPWIFAKLDSHLYQVSEEFALSEMTKLKFTRKWP